MDRPETEEEYWARAMRARINGQATDTCIWCKHWSASLKFWCRLHPDTRRLKCPDFQAGPKQAE